MDNIKEIELNRPQSLLQVINANKTYALWGRGSGKSTGAIGPRILDISSKMPRGQHGIVCPSYIMAERQILPNILGFWETEMGMVDGEDYVIGKKPPEDWIKPIIPVFKFTNIISTCVGTVFPIISLAATASANGLNMQSLTGDEGKFFKEPDLKEVIRAIRGCNKEFGHLAEYQSQWYFTDKYDGDIEWMLKKRDLVKPDIIKAVIAMQLSIYELEGLPFTTEEEYDKRNAQIKRYEKLLITIRKSLVYVSEASTEENRDILGDKYFADQKENSTDIEYDVAIGNKDPDKVENWFYPKLAERHYYNGLNDVDPNKALIIACDYQWRISPVVTAQYGILPGKKDISLNFVHSCHVLHPDGLPEAITKWANHFKNHNNKIVYYTYDKTAVGKNPVGKSFYEVVSTCLRAHGWRVVLSNMGEPPRHNEKFKTINDLLEGNNKQPGICINSLRNTDMIISINRSGAKQSLGKTVKDKDDEKNTAIPAVKTTHYSDTFDMIIVACLQRPGLIPINQSGGIATILS